MRWHAVWGTFVGVFLGSFLWQILNQEEAVDPDSMNDCDA